MEPPLMLEIVFNKSSGSLTLVLMIGQSYLNNSYIVVASFLVS